LVVARGQGNEGEESASAPPPRSSSGARGGQLAARGAFDTDTVLKAPSVAELAGRRTAARARPHRPRQRDRKRFSPSLPWHRGAARDGGGARYIP
jgi:hypothetical protein